MKRNAIFRIVVFALLICILCTVLLFGLCIDDFSWNNFGFNFGISTSGRLADGTPSDSAIFDAADIDEIVIYWISGDIDIRGTDTDAVSYETRNNSTDLETVYSLKNRRLSIGYHAKTHLSTKTKSTDLCVTLPQDWAGKLLKLEAVSARISVDTLHISDDLKMETVSGEVTLSDVTARELYIDTVSGDLLLAGHFGQVDIESVSANAVLDCTAQCPTKIDFESVSGDLKLSLPDGYGFALEMDGVHKELVTDLPFRKSDGKYLSSGEHGNCKIDFETVSGEVLIRAALES